MSKESENTKIFQVRLPADVDRQLHILAAINGNSKNAQIIEIVRKAVSGVRVINDGGDVFK